MRYAFRAVLEQQYSVNQTLAVGSPLYSGSATLDFLGINGEPTYWGDIAIVFVMSLTCFVAVGVVFEKRW